MNIKKNKEILKRNSKEYNKKKFMLMAKATNLVWSDNDIEIKSFTPFTARQIKIIDYVATEINEQQIKELNKNFIIIKIRDIINFYNFSNSGKLIEDIEKDIKSIADVSAWWRYDKNNPKLKTLFRFFNEVNEVENGDKSILKISFNEHWLKRLYNEKPRIATNENGEVLLDEKGKPIKIPYNFYILDNTRRLKSKYSIILFKECNKWKTAPLGWFDYKLEDMKKDFFMLDKSYGYIANHAILPAQKEINEKTDIHISKIVKLPNGKNVEKIRIYLNEKNEQKQERLLNESFSEINEYIDNEEEKYHNKLIDLQVKTEEKRVEERHEANELKKKIREDFIKNNIDRYKEIQKNNTKKGVLRKYEKIVVEQNQRDELNKLLEENGYEKIENKSINKIAKEREKAIIDDAIKSANYAVENNLPYVNGYIEPKEDVYDDEDNNLLNNLNDERLESINKLSKEEIIDLYLEQLKKNKNGNS